MDTNTSVHLQDFPRMDCFEINEKLMDNMDKVRAICSCALFIRDKNNLRVRLPLNKVTIIGNNLEEISDFSTTIENEINVKTVEFVDNVSDFGEKKLVLNFQKIGVKVGSKMPDLMRASKSGRWRIDGNDLEIEGFRLEADEFSIKLEPNRDGVYAVDNYDILLMLDLNTTEELEQEGMVRDLIRMIQQFRKDAKLNVSDKIRLNIGTNYGFLKNSIKRHVDYVKDQTLAVSLDIIDGDLNCDFSFSEEINKNIVQIGFGVAHEAKK
ncbi:MAG: DUF5915 domain-containing protein [Rickettsiales bacterium]|nr:DUF5915 domain-containing protein [Rickettsiales bacterium]